MPGKPDGDVYGVHLPSGFELPDPDASVWPTNEPSTSLVDYASSPASRTYYSAAYRELDLDRCGPGRHGHGVSAEALCA